MSESTKIEWATSTGNPWIGCTKVSPGCKNCYAETLDRQRFSRTMGGGTKENPISHWGPGALRFRTKGFWKDAVKWNRYSRVKCLGCGTWFPSVTWLRVDVEPHVAFCRFCDRATGMLCERPRIFPSLCDWLDDEVPIEWLADFLKLIHDTPNLDWLLLTKRPESWYRRVYSAMDVATGNATMNTIWLRDWLQGSLLQKGSPPSNCWIGVSVENQEYADKRIPELLKIPAKVRFLSVEPLLGPVDLQLVENDGYKLNCLSGRQTDMGRPCENSDARIDWVIVGGESGKGARPCNVEWIRSIVQQCKAAGVPCFVKQLGANVFFDHTNLNSIKHPKGGDPSEWPADLVVREFPK